MPELPISTRRVDKVTYDSLNDTVDFSESSDDRAGRAVVKYGYAQRINSSLEHDRPKPSIRGAPRRACPNRPNWKRVLPDQHGGEAMGVITRVAGTGTRGNSGDDGPATEAELNEPQGVAVTADGGFLIADSFNNVVRKVSSAGVITRVAGTGTQGRSGDDGPATEADLNFPQGVAVTADGGFLIADTDNSVVRKVSSAGMITRVAGTGARGNTGDDGPATDAELNGPAGVAATADGGFLIADSGNSVVRKVALLAPPSQPLIA